MSDKLDRLVAERVMGWPVIGVDVDVDSGGYIRWNTPFRGMDHPTNKCEIWKPSTDIAAAWEVESTLYGRKLFIVLERDPPCEHFECVFVDYCRGYDKYKLPARVWHKSAPMAICLAALRAVGVTESEIQEAMR